MSFDVYTILNLKLDHATSTLLHYKGFSILIDCGLSPNIELEKYNEFEFRTTAYSERIRLYFAHVFGEDAGLTSNYGV